MLNVQPCSWTLRTVSRFEIEEPYCKQKIPSEQLNLFAKMMTLSQAAIDTPSSSGSLTRAGRL